MQPMPLMSRWTLKLGTILTCAMTVHGNVVTKKVDNRVTNLESVPSEIVANSMLATVYNHVPDGDGYFIDSVLPNPNQIGSGDGAPYFVSKQQPVATYVDNTDGFKIQAHIVTITKYYQFPDGTVQSVKVTFVGHKEDNGEGARLNERDPPALMTWYYDPVVLNSIVDYFDPKSSPTPTPPSKKLPTHIHAMIITGDSDPSQVLRGNVILTGGIAALGKGGGTAGRWSTGFKLIPDPDLLSGKKIPPLTPNIFDVRIMHYSVNASMEDDSQKKDEGKGQ